MKMSSTLQLFSTLFNHMESITDVPIRLRPITGITRSSSNSATPIFQDLSDETISVDERNFLCRELRGHHNLLGLPTQFAMSVEDRYGIKRQTVVGWEISTRGSLSSLSEEVPLPFLQRRGLVLELP